MSFFKKLYRKYIHHEFDYKAFANIEKLRRRCPYCQQWFVKNYNRKFTWYEPINGIIIDPKCSCHKWKEGKPR